MSGHRITLPGYRVDKNGKLVPVTKSLPVPARYAAKTRKRYVKGKKS